jgi:hypothetical protein
MKKLLALALLVAGVIFLTGRIALSEHAAGKLLGEIDGSVMDGDAETACARLHEDLEVSITANVAGEQTNVEGGRDEYCDFIEQGAAAMRLMRGQMNLSTRRSDFTMERSWSSPWTAHYTYYEESSMSIPSANVSMNFESEGAATLVLTLGGLKLRKFESHQLGAE